MANINGTKGNDTLVGTYDADTINGKAGNDTLIGDAGNDTLVGGVGSDSLIGGDDDDTLLDSSSYENYPNILFGNNTLNGGAGDDYLNITAGDNVSPGGNDGANLLLGGDGNDTLLASGSYFSYPSTFANNTLKGGAGNDYLNIDYSSGDNLLLGGDGDDTLSASTALGNNTLNGGGGNDTFYSQSNEIFDSQNNKILIGGGGKDKFVLGYVSTITTITDFSGIGKGSNPSATVIASLDTLQFTEFEQTARNLQLTQNGNNLEITFRGIFNPKVVLQNFALENLDNLAQVGNILFYGQTRITDSFDVFDANSNQSTVFKKNTVTFLNELNNNVNGFDNSDDVINGQGGNDKIDGKSGNDVLRGGAGSDTLIGGTGDDILSDNSDSTGNNLLSGGDGNDSLSISGSLIGGYLTGYNFSGFSSGNNTLNGGTGSDTLSASFSTGDNLLSGDNGNDYLVASGFFDYDFPDLTEIYTTSGNNTLNGGAGNDTLDVGLSIGDNLLLGGDGNDSLFGSDNGPAYEVFGYSTSGNNTLNGGAGDDTLNTGFSTADNLLLGGEGNDTLKGGNGNDALYGGTGTDTFVFNSYNEGVDSIYDFNSTNERIQVSADGFGGGLSIGSLSASQFTLGTSATTIAQQFIYDNNTGALYFDQDGSGGAFTQVKFAQLSGGVSLTKNNFEVIA
ncbi:MAG: calcium-binding protein [Nostoc sp.]